MTRIQSGRGLLLAALGGMLGACSLDGGLPDELPPLRDMEEPVAYLAEPDDEAERRELPNGGFTGIYVQDSRQGLDAMMEEPEGVLVERVVENSPGAIAGLEKDDLIFEVQCGAEGELTEVNWPSAWRELELEGEPGERWTVIFDRAGRIAKTDLVLLERVAAAPRKGVERFREDEKVGVVLRTATEVEAREVDLGPGGGAVIIGLARSSPWRRDGLTFGDLLVSVEGEPVRHPQVVMEAIREREPEEVLRLEIARDGERQAVTTTVTEREGRTREVFFPPFFDYEADADGSDTQVLFGLVGYESTKAAWEFTLLWFITFSGGDSETLEEVER